MSDEIESLLEEVKNHFTEKFFDIQCNNIIL
jgi:hypothetical protein